MRVFLKTINPVFTVKIPGIKALSSTLLNANYNKNKSRVKETLRKALYLNIIIDESNNR